MTLRTFLSRTLIRNRKVGMTNLIKPVSLSLLTAWSTVGIASEGVGLCKGQADQILSRLQAEIVCKLNTVDLAAANEIILDVCQAREAQAEIQMEQAVQKAREQEQAEANAWLTESADKPGNKRLKRKSH